MDKDLKNLFAGLLGKIQETLSGVLEKLDSQTTLQEIIADAGKRVQDAMGVGTASSSAPQQPTGERKNGFGEVLNKIASFLQSLMAGGQQPTTQASATPGPSPTKKDKPTVLIMPAPQGTVGGQMIPLGAPIPGQTARHPRALPSPQAGAQSQSPMDRIGTALALITQRLEEQQGTQSKLYQGMQALSRTEFSQSTGLSGGLEKGMLAARAASGDPTAIAQLSKEQAQRFKEDMRMGFQGLMKGFHSERGSEALGEGMTGAAKIMKWITPVGAALVALGGIAFKAVDRLRLWGEQLHKSNMQWAEFSAGMSRVQADQEVRDIAYSQQRGERRATTARIQAEAHSRLREDFAQIEDDMANIRNLAFAGITNYFRDMTGIGLGLQAYNWIRGIAGGPQEAPNPYGASRWMNPQEARDWVTEFNRPNRFRENPEGYVP